MEGSKYFFLGLFKKYSLIVQRYFVQYLSGFDVALLKTIIQVSYRFKHFCENYVTFFGTINKCYRKCLLSFQL